MKRLLHKLIAVLTFTGIAGFLPALAASPAQAIVGGSPVTNNTFAFVAEITDSSVGGGACTGSLIDASWVLTAAHCVKVTTSVGNLTVRVGNTQRDAGGDYRRVSQIVRNVNYTAYPKSGFHDEALLQLSNPVTDVTPIKLGMPSESSLWDGPANASDLMIGDPGFAVGWGVSYLGGPSATTLQYVGVDIGTPAVDPAGSGARMLKIAKGVCYGDSGSPLIVYDNGRMIQAGVMSGTNCNSDASWSDGQYNEVGAGPDRTWVMTHVTNRFYTSFGVGDWDGDGYKDIIARQDSTGTLWLYPGQGVASTSTATRVPLGTGWKGFTPFGVADWNKDGHPDVIARDDATGFLWAYPGQGGRTAYGTRHQLGNYDFREYTPFGVTDWDGNNVADLLVRDRLGTLWLCAGTGSLTFQGLVLPQYYLGTGWNSFTPFGAAEWDAHYDNGYHPDIVARDNDTGVLWLYPGDGRMAMSTIPRYQIGTGWTGYTPFGLADWTYKGHTDILAREDATGDLWLYPGQNSRSISTAPRAQIGNGW